MCPGLLLRQIKDFWRGALLMSTLLSTNNDHTEEFLGDHSKLEERRDTFKRVENSIIELGEIATTLHPFFHTSLSCMRTYKVLGGFMN